MSGDREWITVSLAAKLMGNYDVDYFRRKWCNASDPMLEVRRIPGPRGGRGRVLVLRADLEKVIQSQRQHPDGGDETVFSCAPHESP